MQGNREEHQTNIEQYVDKLQNILARITILANQLNEFGRVSEIFRDKINQCRGRLSISHQSVSIDNAELEPHRQHHHQQDNEEQKQQPLQEKQDEYKSQKLYLYLQRLKSIEKKGSLLHHLASNYNETFTMIDSLLFPDMYFLGIMEPYIVQPRSEKGFGLCAFASADSYYPFSCTKRCVDNTTLYSYCPPIYVASRINHIYSNSQWDANWNSMTLLSDNSIDDRYSYSLHVSVTRTYDLDDISGCPLNPVHRCGIRGYGELPMLGPNHCNCLIICNDKAEICMMRQMSLKQSIYRVLPKAFASRITDNKLVQDVLHNQNILPMAIRQAWLKAKPNIESSLDTLFTFQNHVQAVEAGYLDHPLNTDNAWIELFVWKVKCNKELEISIADQNLSDSADFVWIPIDNISELLIPEFDRNLITLYFN